MHAPEVIGPRFDMVGVGAACVDIVSVLPSFPEASGPGSKLRIQQQTVRCGGQTATASVAAAKLGLRTAFVGAVGADDHGRRVCETLEQHGVNIEALRLRQPPVPTATALILIPATSGERVVLWNRDARLALAPGEVADALLASAAVVHVDDVDLDVSIEVADRAVRAGALVTSDIDQHHAGIRALIARVSIAMFADHVPEALTGHRDHARALAELWAEFRVKLCVTLGAEGAMYYDGETVVREPGFRVNAVDTTGAGDVFRAGFVYALRQGGDARTMLRVANAAAALSCTRMGAIDGAPSLAEVRALVAEREAGRA